MANAANENVATEPQSGGVAEDQEHDAVMHKVRGHHQKELFNSRNNEKQVLRLHPFSFAVPTDKRTCTSQTSTSDKRAP